MVKRKRHRIASSLLCLIVVVAFVVSLPFARPARDKVAVNLNKQGSNLLWSHRLTRITHNDSGIPHHWVWKTHDVLTSNLERLGELEHILAPISKHQYDHFFEWCPRFENLSGPYTVHVYQNEERNYWCFEARFDNNEAGVWKALAEQLKEMKPNCR